MKKHEIGDLNRLYDEGESADQPIFSEMRSNCLMQSSDHYKKIQDRLLERLQTSKANDQIKIRLVKNHVQAITKLYISNIVSQSPGVHIVPFNETELQDKKEAELSNAVWRDAEDKQCLEEKIERWADSFVVMGECMAKVYWNPRGGKILSYKQAVDDEGNPLFETDEGDQVASPVDGKGQQLQPAKGEPVYQGELCIDSIHPFNVLRKRGVDTMKDSPFLCIRDMLPIEEVKDMLAGIEDKAEREEKEKFVVESSKTTFKIFDSTSGEYNDSKGMVLLRQFFFRPCEQYPEGYFYITTDTGVLFEGPLPYGIFPIVTEGFDFLPTSPRGRSIIRPLRPVQAEINRMASLKAETSITLGRTMVITQVGSKLSKGQNFAGVLEMNVNGPAPTIISGQSGNQFESGLAAEVAELYKLANIEYELAENQIQDPYQQIFRSLSQKKKYALYAKKFERFLCNVAETYLKLAKRYLPDDYVIRAIGKREAVNLPEFRRIDDEGFNIEAKPMSTDIESMMGKNLNIMNVLQYCGKDLPPNARGKLISQMPFLDQDDFLDLTLDSQNVDNDILAMDRGEYRPAQDIDKHDLYIDRLNNRMKQADFKLLSPQIQQMYQQKLQEHIQKQAEQEQKLKAMEADYWPTSGGLVKVDVYDPKTGKRMLLPQDAIRKLVDVLEQQGTQQAALEQMDQQNQLQVLGAAHQLIQNQAQPQMMPPAGAPPMMSPQDAQMGMDLSQPPPQV